MTALGRDEYCDEYDVDVAGVNHLSFILRGSYRGEDLYDMLRRSLAAGRRPPPIREESRHIEHHIHNALRKLAHMVQRYGTIIFSTENDGIAHLFYKDMYAGNAAAGRPPTAAQAREIPREFREAAGYL